MLDACVSAPQDGPPDSFVPCSPWPCAPGQVCAEHAPRISAVDAAPLIAIFRPAALAVAA